MHSEIVMEHPPLAKRAEAAAWLARLRGPNRTSEVERGFQRWLSAHPEHARAFEQLTDRVEMVERLRIRPLPQHWRASQRVARANRLAPLAAAATLVLALAAFLWYQRDAGISTAVGEQRTLALKDGTHVYLNTNTRVTVRYDEEQRLIELAAGEALFEVAKHFNWPFVVQAGDRRITALGTRFVVRRENDALSVVLLDGKVAVAPAEAEINKASATLTPGERLTVAKNQAPALDRPELKKVTAWRQGQVALDDLSLGQAVREMNRYSARKLVVESPELESVRVGGFFRMGDSESFAQAVAQTYGFEVIEREEEIVLAGAPEKNSSQ